MDKLAYYLSVEEAQQRIAEVAAATGATEFAQVRNLDYIPTEFELYPLMPATPLPMPKVVAFAVDMDGTSTTTEPLALNSLEYMVRRFTNRLTAQAWPGLDPVKDHPYVIGNSNFRHTEFLIERYRDWLDPAALRAAYFEAVAWTLACMDDPQRRSDVAQNARNVGLGDLLDDPVFQTLTQRTDITDDNVVEHVAPFIEKYGPAFHYSHQGQLVGAALDIYYFRYHAIMRKMELGQGAELAEQLLGDRNRRLVEPMPGYEVFIPLIKGWLGSAVDALYEPLRAHLLASEYVDVDAATLDAARPQLTALGCYFEQHPAKVSLVTASIAYEAHACMHEVIRVMAEDVGRWPIDSATRDRIAAGLADYRRVFDGFINASDACEPRLKPHRDLYSLAMHQMAVSKPDYPYCIGIEDTEPGIIALRAAGIGCAVALPNHDTSRQDYSAATSIAHGGLPELILMKHLHVSDAALATG